MKISLRKLIFSGLMVLAFHSLSIGAQKSSVRFLTLGAGARELAMGGTSVSISGDVNSLYWNPAGLVNISQSQWGLTHAESFVDTRYDFMALGFPSQYGAWGVDVLSFRSGLQEGRGKNKEKTSDFSADDLAVGLGFSSAIDQFSSAGIKISVLQSRIENNRTQGFAVDLGVQQKIMLSSPLSLGVSLKNLGPTVQYQNERSYLPASASFGLGKELFRGLLLTGEFQHELYGGQNQFLFGSEFRALPMLSLRGGYSFVSTNSLNEGSDNILQSFGHLNGGFGLTFSRFSLDYSFTPTTTLDQSHRLSLISRF